DNTMIQRSGLRHLPEILRLAPGLQVVRFGANAWTVSARSMPSLGGNKLLVLSDGRSIYSEEISTVLWEAQDYCLEDLERIEVIQGPGGAIWGFNAFDGVVNIITKKAKETQGGVVDAGVDNRGSAFFQTRYGGRIKENLFYRLYYAGATLEEFETPAGYPAEDWLKRSKFGLRFDVEPAAGSLLFLDAAISLGSARDEFSPGKNSFEDKYLHGRYELAVSRNLDFGFQAYYNANDQVYGKTSFGEALTLGV
ncbi:MAG: TonB-dependent receptor plug domain-containing protein, partial [Desulfobacterales bacterium]|nr:TonB-dependent receptor plug domain-containing protein [Desulfobacterales bacterium]